MVSAELEREKDFAAHSGFVEKDNFLTYVEIFAAYAQSELGSFHSKQKLRFGRYSYQREEMLADLGDDVHPLLHMPYTFKQIVNPLVSEQVRGNKAGELSPEDIKALRLSALIHDMGENEHPSLQKTCGDVHKFDRTPEHEIVEQAVRQYIYEVRLGFVADSLLARAEEIIMKTDPTDFATETFEIAENLGYFKTGLRAGELTVAEFSRSGNFEIERNRQLARLAINVPPHWVEILENTAQTYPHVRNEVSAARGLYNFVQTEVRPNIDV